MFCCRGSCQLLYTYELKKRKKNTNMPGGVKKSARVRVKMDIPDLPQSATKEEKRVAYLLAYNLGRRSRTLNKQRKRTSHGRTLSVPNFDAVMRFGHEESMELLKGGFRVSGSPLSELDCAHIIEKVDAKSAKSKAFAKRKTPEWKVGGDFGKGSLRYTDAIPFMDTFLVKKLEDLLLNFAIPLRFEKDLRFANGWVPLSIATNLKDEVDSEGNPVYQEVHSDDQSMGMSLSDTLALGSRIGIFIALQKGCSFGVSPDGLNQHVLDAPVGKCVMFSPVTTAHFGTQKKAMRLFVMCEVIPKD